MFPMLVVNSEKCLQSRIGAELPSTDGIVATRLVTHKSDAQKVWMGSNISQILEAILSGVQQLKPALLLAGQRHAIVEAAKCCRYV